MPRGIPKNGINKGWFKKGLKGYINKGSFKKGHEVSEETRKKISEINKKLKLKPPSRLGKHHSKEAIEKIRKSLIGNKYSLGNVVSTEVRKKISNTMKRKGIKYPSWLNKKRPPFTEEHRKRISLGKKGKKLNISEETRKKLKELRSGENSNFWQGGIAKNPYSVDWGQTLKRSIRERDRYTCQICSKQQEDSIFHVHHINYIKTDCSPDNLITLCVKCHAKTNVNREHWINYFKIWKYRMTIKS